MNVLNILYSFWNYFFVVHLKKKISHLKKLISRPYARCSLDKGIGTTKAGGGGGGGLPEKEANW